MDLSRYLKYLEHLKHLKDKAKRALQSISKSISKNFHFKQLLIAIGVTLIIIVILFTKWLMGLSKTIDAQLEQKRFSPPLEFFASPELLSTDYPIKNLSELEKTLATANIEKVPLLKSNLDKLNYKIYSYDECQKRFPDLGAEPSTCVEIRTTLNHALIFLEESETETKIIKIFGLPSFEELEGFELEPILFAQFYGKDPILRQRVELGDTPPICLNAILAIEDNRFLEHSGISVIGILRAFIRNMTSGKVVQGGSTITQQLVKNYFLTHKKTISRKFKEIFMALILESKTSKDEILEAYINEIYMGQNGSFQIRGFESASEYYFGKNLEDLNLPECSLLAAVVNSPGLFNPFRHPENALERRKLVLQKLLDANQISQEEMDSALKVDLPKTPSKLLSEPAPYFVDAVIKQLNKIGIDTTYGLSVVTTMNIQAQEAAQKAVYNGIKNLEENNKEIIKIKEKTKKLLEGFLISADPKTGFVQAIVGGRDYRISQYNRAIASRRQVGSIMKPFVYYSALQATDETDEIYQPLTIINDEKFKIKYDGQVWEPKNYGNKYFGMIPMYFALKSSLNCATATLGIRSGLFNVVENARLAGIDTDLEAYPSLTLGAFELPALEVLRAYSTFANLGEKVDLTLIRKIKDLDGEVLYEFTPERSQALDPVDTSILVGMMKQTLLNGTGAYSRLLGFTNPAAGKTGTTSDNKDSWFAGFTPYHVAVAWVGYDDNTESKLTGASGALPIWTQYMKEYATKFPADDFKWAEGTIKKEISVEDQESLNIPTDEKRSLESIELIFRDN